MAGNYAIQFHDKSGKEPMSEKTFQDFSSLFTFITANKTSDWANSVNVHLPSYATDEEREKIRALGFISN